MYEMIIFFKAKILSAVAFFGSFLCHQRNEQIYLFIIFRILKI